MNLVFAVDTVVIDQGLVRKGTHWPANDPLVLAHPDIFSEDPRYGLQFSVEPVFDEEPRQKRAYVRR